MWNATIEGEHSSQRVIHVWRRRAFSIVELLVVLGIITLLVAILVPALIKARERAWTVKCMTNTANLGRGIEAFRVDHRGRAQLTAQGLEEEWLRADPDQKIFAYERTANALGRRRGLPWAVAYGPYVGESGLNTAADMFERLPFRPTPEEQRRLAASLRARLGSRPIYECPSDDLTVNRIWSPSPMWGLLSYGVNEDICGVARVDETGGAWAYGHRSLDAPLAYQRRRREGRLENTFRPSQVVLVGDIGGEDRNRPAPHTSGGAYGPYLEHAQARWGRLPLNRHGRDGKVVFTFVDGHTATVSRRSAPRDEGPSQQNPGYRYVPRVRVSPYPPFSSGRPSTAARGR